MTPPAPDPARHGPDNGTETIGIDIGGTNIRAARVTSAGTIIARAHLPSNPDPRVVHARCLELVEGLRTPAVTGLGIGVPGQVDVAAGRVLSGGYVDLSGVDFAAGIAAATGFCPVLDNDATMALLAECACGAARGAANVVLLTIGTGIGGAILNDGRVLRGGGVAGQLGHVVVDPGGRVCACGRRGCVETVSSGTALGSHIADAGMPADTRVEHLLAHTAEPGPRAVLTAWATPLRAAIDTLIAACNPDRVVIGGGMGAAAVAALQLVPASPSWFSGDVVAAALGDDAGVIGAARAANHAPAVRRVVLVNGVPASGKTGVARALSAATGWPIFSLDTVKDPFLHAFAGADRDFNRALGRASYGAIFSLLRDAPPGMTAIVDAWFGFQPPEVLAAHLAAAGIARTAQIWCTAPPDTIGARYAARAGQRPPGHPGAEYVPELVTLAARAAPLAGHPTLTLDTTRPADPDAVLNWLGQLWPDQGWPSAKGSPLAGLRNDAFRC